MADQPTIYLANWSSPKLHGPGRKLTIMRKPRHWEHGAGRVVAVMPFSAELDDVRSGRITMDEYRAKIERRLARTDLEPGALQVAIPEERGPAVPVEDGDTLCCACAVGAPCHRVWLAPFLVAAGWRVVLDGVEVTGG